jgi:hypothetical protein
VSTLLGAAETKTKVEEVATPTIIGAWLGVTAPKNGKTCLQNNELKFTVLVRIRAVEVGLVEVGVVGVEDAPEAEVDTKAMKIILPRLAKPLLSILMAAVVILMLTSEPVYLMMSPRLPGPQPQLTALNSIMA